MMMMMFLNALDVYYIWFHFLRKEKILYKRRVEQQQKIFFLKIWKNRNEGAFDNLLINSFNFFLSCVILQEFPFGEEDFFFFFRETETKLKSLNQKKKIDLCKGGSSGLKHIIK